QHLGSAQRSPPRDTRFPYTPLFRSELQLPGRQQRGHRHGGGGQRDHHQRGQHHGDGAGRGQRDAVAEREHGGRGGHGDAGRVDGGGGGGRGSGHGGRPQRFSQDRYGNAKRPADRGHR